MNLKKIAVTVVLIIFVGAILFEVVTQMRHTVPTATAATNKGMVLFYSNECPHCRKVEAYMTKHNTLKKLPITEQELKPGSPNISNLVDKAKRCGMQLNRLPIPFLWTGKTCVTGDQPIINYFKQKTGKK